MDWHDAALAGAGVIGSGVAIVHGVLTQRFMVVPLQEIATPRMSRSLRRLVAMLLQFSTFNWLVGGLALVFAAVALGREGKQVTGLLVGSSFLFAAIGNLWATRGRHPGWVLYGVAVLLIAFSLGKHEF